MTSSGGDVTIRCAGSPGQSSLYSLKLSKVLGSNPNATTISLLSILHHNAMPQVLYPIEGSSATGSVQDNFLLLRLSRARCQDAGLYVCQAEYLNTVITSDTDNSSLTVTVSPGQMSISTDPGFKHWVVNQSLSFTCRGPLGTVHPHTQIAWQWEYWDPEGKTWRLVNMSYSDVITEDANQQPCYQNGSSQIRRRLQLADSGRVYRCYVTKDGVSFTDFAGRYQFGSVLSVTDDATDDYDEGFVVGAGVGVGSTIGVVIFIIVVVVCLCNRSDDPCCGDDTKEEAERSAGTVTPETGTLQERSKSRHVAVQTSMTSNDKDDGYDVIDDGAVSLGPEEEVAMDYSTHVFDAASAQQQTAAAEEVLRGLLSTRHVLCWKVTGHAHHTSFLLHLSPAPLQAPPPGRQQGRWRKKNAAKEWRRNGGESDRLQRTVTFGSARGRVENKNDNQLPALAWPDVSY